LFACEYPKPDWWSAPPTATVDFDEQPTRVAVTGLTRPKDLFDSQLDESLKPTETPSDTEPQATVVSVPWLDRLFSSAGYKDQKGLVRRHAPSDDLVRRCLATLN